MNDASESCNASLDDLVADVVDQFMERVHRGEQPCIEDYADRHPEAAALLRQILPALQVLQPPSEEAGGAASPERTEGQGGTLGDFRILREVGRGGMGIVYEAEQISLGRRVALKVLPFAATLDPRQLQRFHNEARAAASLHHEHIVPVFAIGQERSVHFFAMQFIEGRTLADLIAQERRGAALPASDAPTAASGADTAAIAGTTTASPPRAAAFYRQVAEWGIQAAEALEHAHSLGIVHRDIKPGNLMIDGHGQLWIADFGLARRAAESDLTMTGDLLGTLRYMSPEQALAKHDLVDHRSDVYSLGATLYELLTLHAAAEGKDRQDIIQHITQVDATSLRRHDRSIPADLETIVLKALAKEPDGRYATTKGLAEDLRRFLASEPIRAKRPSLTQRTMKWARRNRTVVNAGAAALFFVVAVLGAVGGWVANERSHRGRQVDEEVTALLNDVDCRRREIHAKLAHPIKVCELLSKIDGWHEKLATARAVWKNAKDLAASNDDIATAKLNERIVQIHEGLNADEADWRLANNLDEVRLREFENGYEWAVGVEYEHRLRDIADWKTFKPTDLASTIKKTKLRYVLTATLDHWAHAIHRNKGGDQVARLLETARLVDPDPWRDQLRDAKNWNDRGKLEKLMREVDFGNQTPQILAILAATLADQKGDASGVLRAALLHYPQDFWLHYSLGKVIQNPDQKIGCFQAALALRPESRRMHHEIANALITKMDFDGAIQHFEKCLSFDKNWASAHYGLAIALAEQKDYNRAAEHLRKATKLKPKDTTTHSDLEAAILYYRRFLELVPEDATARSNLGNVHYHLGNVLRSENDLDGAVSNYRKAIELNPKSAPAYGNLGIALADMKDYDGAIQQYRKVLELKPKDVRAHTQLGNVLFSKKDFDGAVLHYRKNIELNPKWAPGYGNLGNALWSMKDYDGAIQQFHKVLELDPKNFSAHQRLGRTFKDKNDLDKAIYHHRKALELNPKFTRSHIELINAFRMKREFASVFQSWNQFFLTNPIEANNLTLGLRFRAAQDAILAIGSQNPNADKITDADRMAMRKQAFAWLRADLDSWDTELQKKQVDTVRAVADALPQWQASLDLSGMRDELEVAKLPEEERKSWQQLWTDVEQLRMQASGMFKETTRLSGMVSDKERETVHEVNLQARTTYVIDLGSKTFDTFVRLEDAKGKKLAENDDIENGIDTNSRLLFTPESDGVYRIVTSAFLNSGTGPYTLTIREFIK